MIHYILPAVIRWRRRDYSMQAEVADGVVSVRVYPDSAELEQAVRQSVEQDPINQLSGCNEFGFDYIASDLHRGE